MKNLAFTFLCSFLSFASFAQALPIVEVVTKDNKISIRGLSVVNNKTVWVSGSNGTIAKSVDGGTSWKWLNVTGFEKRDFRDIEAFDATTAVMIAVDTPAYILRTIDGGESWKVVYQNNTPGMFLDALEFWNENAGIVVGDPINNKFFIARSFDGGTTWQEIPNQFKPDAQKGEALFAASGTNVRVLDRDEAVFVSGGLHSRVFIRNQPVTLPIIQGKETTGANSIAVADNGKLKGGNKMIVVGGDFTNPTSDTLNCFYSNDRGKTWKRPSKPPHGYKSCVTYINKNEVVCCGLTGVDYSADGGKTWTKISNESFHTCQKAKDGETVYFAGSNGKIGKLIFPK